MQEWKSLSLEAVESKIIKQEPICLTSGGRITHNWWNSRSTWVLLEINAEAATYPFLIAHEPCNERPIASVDDGRVAFSSRIAIKSTFGTKADAAESKTVQHEVIQLTLQCPEGAKYILLM